MFTNTPVSTDSCTGSRTKITFDFSGPSNRLRGSLYPPSPRTSTNATVGYPGRLCRVGIKSSTSRAEPMRHRLVSSPDNSVGCGDEKLETLSLGVDKNAFYRARPMVAFDTIIQEVNNFSSIDAGSAYRGAVSIGAPQLSGKVRMQLLLCSTSSYRHGRRDICGGSVRTCTLDSR